MNQVALDFDQTKLPNSIVYRIEATLRPLIYQLMTTELGLDPYWCVECLGEFDKPLTIHHRKYAGATIYDLEFLCMSCQTLGKNKGLA